MRRRGKFLLVDVEVDGDAGGGGGDMVWVMHLGMSGRLSVERDGAQPEPHTHFVAVLDDGAELRFVDPRTFGFVAVLTPEELSRSGVALLGPDALDDLPSTAELARALAGRTAPVKALLLDQRILAGLGNIYADEVLFRAGIHPRRPGGSLSPEEVGRLREAIRPVLEAGLSHGGTSLADLAYLLPDGTAGGFAERLSVYGRAGQACPRCGSMIERTVVAQRSSHFCPACQGGPE